MSIQNVSWYGHFPKTAQVMEPETNRVWKANGTDKEEVGQIEESNIPDSYEASGSKKVNAGKKQGKSSRIEYLMTERKASLERQFNDGIIYKDIASSFSTEDLKISVKTIKTALRRLGLKKNTGEEADKRRHMPSYKHSKKV